MSLSLDDPCAIFVERTWTCKKNQWLEEMLLLKGKNGTENLASIFVFNSFLHRAFIFTKASASFLRSTIAIKQTQLISVTRILVNFSTSLTRFNSSAFFSIPLFLLFFFLYSASEFSKAFAQ